MILVAITTLSSDATVTPSRPLCLFFRFGCFLLICSEPP